MIEFPWADETWTVLGDHALLWPRRRTLCVADIHLGKAASFRRAGVPVPETTTDADLARPAALVAAHRPERLVILGDLLHARDGRADGTMAAFVRWRSAHARLDILLVRGNHDKRAGDPPPDWSLRVEDEPFADPGDGSVAFAHYPDCAPDRPLLCGHIHPAVLMLGPTRGVRAPCFWFGPRTGVLPAFGSFTGSKVIRPTRHDRVFALGDGEVVEVGAPARKRPARAPARGR